MPIGARSVVAKRGRSAERLGMTERGALMKKRPERGAMRAKLPGARSADAPCMGPTSLFVKLVGYFQNSYV